MSEFFRKLKTFIISIYDFIKFTRTINKNDNYIVAFSHDANDSGGAPIVLFELLKKIKKENPSNRLILLCKNNGNLKEMSKKEGIESFIYQYIYKLYIKKILELKVRLIIVNTVVCANVLSELQRNFFEVPIIWWLHESYDMFDEFCYSFPQKYNPNVYIKCVCNHTMDVAKKYINNDMQIMHYGIEDLYSKNSYEKKCNNDKFVILLIGRLCDRKNQIAFLETYNKLPTDIKNNIKIKIIAQSWEKDYKIRIEEICNDDKNIEIIKGIPHSKIYEYYEKSNLLVLCSKFDPLPVVVTEAMMMKCPVLISSGCGQYHVIKDKISGYKYKLDNDEELLEKIKIAYINKGDVSVGENGRKIFLCNFSLDYIYSEIEKVII